MMNEATTAASTVPVWLMLTIVFGVIGMVFGGVTVAMVGIMKAINAHQEAINKTVERGIDEHKDWRGEMKEMKSQMTSMAIQTAVDRGIQEWKERNGIKP